MTTQSQTKPEILRDMGDGVIIRRLEERDLDGLAALHTEVFSPRAAKDARSVIDGTWAIGQRDHFLIAEDTTTGKIVSSLTLLRKTFTFGDAITFGVGVPEWVLTHPDYRRKRLIRAQTEIVHEWSEARGDLMQVIGGIPNYYRQFGYDMALEMGPLRVGFKSYVPKLKEGETEPYRVRPATTADVPFIVATAAHAHQRYLITSGSDATYWDGLIRRAQSDDPFRHIVAIVETPEGDPIGYLVHFAWARDHQIGVSHFELKAGVSWLPVALPVVRYLCAKGEEYAARENKEFGTFGFFLGTEHPLFEVLDDKLPRSVGAYAWYVRIPDLPAFIRHIAPVLEARLARSALPNHTGDLKLSFYRSGLRLAFEHGKLVTVEPWQPTTGTGEDPAEPTDAAFPDLTFYQLLLGYRTLEQLEATRPDIFHEGDGPRALLRALFPRQISHVWL
jgi:hypothetical protein